MLGLLARVPEPNGINHLHSTEFMTYILDSHLSGEGAQGSLGESIHKISTIIRPNLRLVGLVHEVLEPNFCQKPAQTPWI